ncbi:hypothetical protein ACFL3E_00765 [Patescibacteria group bacterium]
MNFIKRLFTRFFLIGLLLFLFLIMLVMKLFESITFPGFLIFIIAAWWMISLYRNMPEGPVEIDVITLLPEEGGGSMPYKDFLERQRFDKSLNKTN